MDSRERPCSGAWVDEVLAIVLLNLLLVGMPTDQDVDIKLSLNGSERLHVAPWHYLMTVYETYLEVA